MLEVTEMILASINAKPMRKGEIYELPYLKNISEYGIEWSLSELVSKDFVIEKVEKNVFSYKCNKKGRKYLIEHGYLE